MYPLRHCLTSSQSVSSELRQPKNCFIFIYIVLFIYNVLFIHINRIICRFQWPRNLRRRSAAARLLRSCFRIPPGAWMFVCCECCVLSGRGLCDELIIGPEESYRLSCVVVCDLEKPQEWGGHDPRWVAEKKKKINRIMYTECPRRNMLNFGRVFLMLKYTDITQNTYIQSWTVTEIMAREKWGLLAVPNTATCTAEHHVTLCMSLRMECREWTLKQHCTIVFLQRLNTHATM
jgi:hypothetical protein